MSHASTSTRERARLLVQGRVQGVGFRPTLYREITARNCGGSIRNTPRGVEIEIEGQPQSVQDIIENFRSLIPPRARVDDLDVERTSPLDETEFTIQQSGSEGRSLLPIPPDLAVCPECHDEVQNPRCRRHRYPFNTCTSCGPRFTIARAVPFDRPTSAMDEFPLGTGCRSEYEDPSDRRFHAQTMSCPECGPSLRFIDPQDTKNENQDPLGETRKMLAAGGIIAVKGVGGFHLACDATDDAPVRKLRERKQRPHKPFAVMARDMEACEEIARPDQPDRELLQSPESPIVLLSKRLDSPLSQHVAPGLADVGVMLPYTPMHSLLFDDPAMPPVLVMTSCNRSDEPIAVCSARVMEQLQDVVDGVLDHDRPIENRCDDSLVTQVNGHPLPMRRSRGYVPEPVIMHTDGPSVLAVGAMWKNTFAVTTGQRAFLSQHIGNVSDADNARHFGETVRRFCELLRLEPEAVACDLHPDYPTTRFAHRLAENQDLEMIEVQHHHAHLVSCLTENGLDGPVIGVSMDGTGYGDDGAVWGGEFMLASKDNYERLYHLEYVPMPGGDRAVLEPARMALSHLRNVAGADESKRRMETFLGDRQAETLLNILDEREFSPLTSSCGRLFDAVAAILGVRCEITYEGQAACELEASCRDDEEGHYDFGMQGEEVLVAPVIRAICSEMDSGVNPPIIATRFHNTVSRIILEVCQRIRRKTGLEKVALSGGVMQNRYLLKRAIPALGEKGFEVLLQTRVPPNDGGLCLGQAAVALARLSS